MLSNAGHAIQKLINNIPIAVTSNLTSTSVVTNGGNIYQTGLVRGRVQDIFENINTNVGHVIDTKSTNNALYILNSTGSVFEYNHINSEGFGNFMKEVYAPATCDGDKAIKIAAGSFHLIILTESNKVYGVGNNDQYQLVPQGQCKYETAVQIFITDTNLHDNNCVNSFSGLFTQMEYPLIPNETNCNNISCVKDKQCDAVIGYINVTAASVTPFNTIGVFSVPVYGDINYVGFLCVDDKNCASGSVTYTLSKIYIKSGCFTGKFTYNDNNGCNVCEINLVSSTEVPIFLSNGAQPANTNLCAPNFNIPITGSYQVDGRCGTCAVVNIDTPQFIPIPTVSFVPPTNTLIMGFFGCSTNISVIANAALTAVAEPCVIDMDLDFDVPLNCNVNVQKRETVLPQPCWSEIYAGYNISALVDSSNRIYVLGSLYQVRSNKSLLKKSSLDELLSKTHASISFPADQLNCKNNSCNCSDCNQSFKTDLNKFGIHLSFPQGQEKNKDMNVCDFLKSLQEVNETNTYDDYCAPCDSYIYLNISNENEGCGVPSTSAIGSVTLFNKKSVSKLVSQGSPDFMMVQVSVNSFVEFDINKYSIDGNNVELDKLVKLKFCNQGPNVNLFIDIDQPGGIQFIADSNKCTVEFPIESNSSILQFMLNYGSIMDPVVLTNLKHSLSLDSFYPSPQYKNPFGNRIINTYLRGGDRIRFVSGNPKNLRQAVTADLPTVFRLNRRIVDIGVGLNNLSVLVNSIACPNDIYAIGNNCNGELGIGSNETVVSWNQTDRTIFDSPVNKVISGKIITFYVTQSGSVYASGHWKHFINSSYPHLIKSINKDWKIEDISISSNHIVFLGKDGCLYGLGDNSIGELGLGHNQLIPHPIPMSFFYKTTNDMTKQLMNNFDHPMERKNKQIENNVSPPKRRVPYKANNRVIPRHN